MQQAHPLQGLDYKHMTRQLATEASIFEADATETVYFSWQVSKPHREGAGRISAAARKHFLGLMGQACVGN